MTKRMRLIIHKFNEYESCCRKGIKNKLYFATMDVNQPPSELFRSISNGGIEK